MACRLPLCEVVGLEVVGSQVASSSSSSSSASFFFWCWCCCRCRCGRRRPRSQRCCPRFHAFPVPVPRSASALPPISMSLFPLFLSSVKQKKTTPYPPFNILQLARPWTGFFLCAVWVYSLLMLSSEIALRPSHIKWRWFKVHLVLESVRLRNSEFAADMRPLPKYIYIYSYQASQAAQLELPEEDANPRLKQEWQQSFLRTFVGLKIVQARL